MIDDPAGWVAAGAAVVAAGIVAWQSWETRRSADASAKAVKTANDALEVARQQAAEAVRARIDAATPAISVYLDPEVDWPPLQPSGFLGGEPNPLTQGLTPESMFMPRHGDQQIMVRAGVRVANDSGRRVRVDVHGLIQKADGVTPVPSPLLLAPGAELDAWCAATHDLAGWIEVHKTRARGEPGDEVVASVHYIDPADTGANDRWELVIGGTPVAPVADMEGGWQIISTPHPSPGAVGAIGTASVVLRHRRYYLSKSRGQEITD